MTALPCSCAGVSSQIINGTGQGSAGNGSYEKVKVLRVTDSDVAGEHKVGGVVGGAAIDQSKILARCGKCDKSPSL